MSDVGLAKACRRLKIPLPGRGHWARVRAGQSLKKTPLPQLPANSCSFIEVTALSEQEVLEMLAAKNTIKERVIPVVTIHVDEVLSNPHPLIKSALKRLSIKSGWNDERGTRKAPTEVLDIAVTPDSLDRALRTMDALVKHLTHRGVGISIDALLGQTVLALDGVSVPLSLSEKVKRIDHETTPEETKARERHAKRTRWEPFVLSHSIPRYDYHPTGDLTISVGQWPQRNCRDTRNTRLEDRLGEVVQNVFEVARIVKEREFERVRWAEERRIADARYEFAVKRLDDEKEALSKLESDANDFERSRRILSYVLAIERHALDSGSMTSEMESWIAWAKLKADWLNPVNQISDLIIDAPLPKRPGYW